MDKQIKIQNNNIDDELSQEFIDNGFLIEPVCNQKGLIDIRRKLIEIICNLINTNYPKDEELFLNSFHKYVKLEKLNDLRLSIFESMNSIPWFKDVYYSLAEDYLKLLVGNELVIQKRVNLSIQIPKDSSSILPVHADVWNGDSPFELVIWIPLVDCFKTKSMFLLSSKEEKILSKKTDSFRTDSSEDLFNKIKNDLNWLNVKFGHALLFSQNLMHGNRINEEGETRWSLNCRFKSLFSPYSSKKLGDFFEPLKIKPVTKLGMNYQFPKGFEN